MGVTKVTQKLIQSQIVNLPGIGEALRSEAFYFLQEDEHIDGLITRCREDSSSDALHISHLSDEYVRLEDID